MQRVACSMFAVAALWVVSGAYSARAEPPEEIVVTAERRERPLAHAPLSALVASGADLRRSAIESSQDLPFRTPGLAFSTNTVLGQPYLRGVGSDLITAGAESSVATLVDGVYRTRPVASIHEFFDVERVEVLMGPQGALFGRNATGGVIHVITRDPEPGVAAEGDVSYGNFDAVRVRGALNLPLAGERVVLRIAGLRARRDGFTRELSSGERLDDEYLSDGRGGRQAPAPIRGPALLSRVPGGGVDLRHQRRCPDTNLRRGARRRSSGPLVDGGTRPAGPARKGRGPANLPGDPRVEPPPCSRRGARRLPACRRRGRLIGRAILPLVAARAMSTTA